MATQSVALLAVLVAPFLGEIVRIALFGALTLFLPETRWAFLAGLDSFVRGLALLFWTTATWWIPMRIGLGVFRHVVGNIALPFTRRGYDTSSWSIVFPLGRYTVATERLVVEMGLSFLEIIPQWFVYVALLACGMTSLGLAHSIVTRIHARISSGETDGSV